MADTYVSSEFDRSFKQIENLKKAIETNELLNTIRTKYLQTGKAFLAFRKGESTIYINGKSIVSLNETDCEPTITARILPIARSQYPNCDQQLKEKEWKDFTHTSYSFSDLFPEIVDFAITDEESESKQVSELYKYSVFASQGRWILLDIEASFNRAKCKFKDGVKTDKDGRIDAILFDTKERQLMFVEVKRNSDPRLRQDAVKTQMNRYKRILSNEKDKIISSYDKVIGYFNVLCGFERLQKIDTQKDILFLLMITEFIELEKKPPKPEKMTEDNVGYVAFLKKKLNKEGYPVEYLGGFGHASQDTFTNKWKKEAIKNSNFLS